MYYRREIVLGGNPILMIMTHTISSGDRKRKAPTGLGVGKEPSPELLERVCLLFLRLFTTIIAAQ